MNLRIYGCVETEECGWMCGCDESWYSKLLEISIRNNISKCMKPKFNQVESM